MLYQIPLINIPNQSITTTLNGVRCQIELVTRNDSLYINKIAIENDTKISGIICHNEENLLLYPVIGITGKLYFKDTQGKEDPRWNGLNSRWFLLYEV